MLYIEYLRRGLNGVNVCEILLKFLYHFKLVKIFDDFYYYEKMMVTMQSNDEKWTFTF